MKKKIVNMILAILAFMASVDYEKPKKNMVYLFILLLTLLYEMTTD